jgi:hypothetical protein
MPEVDERTPLLPPEERVVEYTPARRRLVVATTLLSSFLATLDMTSECDRGPTKVDL